MYLGGGGLYVMTNRELVLEIIDNQFHVAQLVANRVVTTLTQGCISGRCHAWVMQLDTQLLR